MNIKQATLSFNMALLLTGCANLAPNYQQPAVALSEQWITESLAKNGDANMIARDLGWQDYFLDPQLQVLIATALTYNHDLRKAALNVEIAEQQYGISRTARLPTLGANGGFTRSRSPSSPRTTITRDQYQVGLGISNFELDFWGRVKNQSEASLNQYLQTREARDAAQLSIINGVARAFYQWRVAQIRLDLAKKTQQSREKSLKLIELRMREGMASGTDVATAQSSIATVRSSYQQNQRAVKQAKNAIATLVGQPVDALALPTGVSLSAQFPTNELYADTPSTALLHRPDIRQAEYGLKAANANIGAARAAMFPTISLTGNLGYASAELGDLFSSVGRSWSFGPSISLPIFDAGRRKANVRVSELQQQVAVESYQGAVQAAFQDVSNALIARETLSKQYSAELDGAKATSKTLSLVKLQLQEGLANGLNLLDAERANLATRMGLQSTLLQTLTNRVDLYTAMGGGLNDANDATMTKQ